jgi:hypothetical protein
MSERLRELRALQAQLLGLGDPSAYSSVTVIRADGSETTIENPAQADNSSSDAQLFPPEDAAEYAGLPAVEVDR